MTDAEIVGAVMVKDTAPPSGVVDAISGAVAIVEVEIDVEKTEDPPGFTDETWKSYSVPAVSPVTVWVRAELAACVKVVQVPDGEVRY